jgi:hypothetical protein
LLGGEAAVLDGEGGPVAGGPHVLDAGDTPVRVDGDESVGVGRDGFGGAAA